MRLFRRKKNKDNVSAEDPKSAVGKNVKETVNEKLHEGSRSAFAVLRDFVAGDVFLRETVQRQWLYILMVVTLSLVYINNRFLYERQLRELDAKKKELVDLKYRSLTIAKELKVAGRRTTILNELKNHGSDLDEATAPVIIIE